MDLSLLKDNLSDFATFGKNVGTAFQDAPALIAQFLGFFDNFGDNTEDTSTAIDNFSS